MYKSGEKLDVINLTGGLSHVTIYEYQRTRDQVCGSESRAASQIDEKYSGITYNFYRHT